MSNQISTQTISFNNQSLITVEQNGNHYVAMKPICENIGLAWEPQVLRIKRDEVLSQGMIVMITPTNGGNQNMICLPIEYLGKAERKTTADDRTGLRNAVNMLVSKKGLIYSDAYNLVHQYMNVERIEDIPADKLQSAVEYVHRIVLEGQLITEPKKNELFTREFTEHELQQLVWAWFALLRGTELCQNLHPALKQIGSHYAAPVRDIAYEYRSTIRRSKPDITRMVNLDAEL
ncbi:P22AR C-terminal domain-containing protein [Aggregatibacter actinomycetemcomitans]|uniref:P22AR C-terminal domain-containing protein n=1 Tax=Aggregatibacter actinomycetemcomitans TaxID=714 RepID=UPI001F392FC1|nr:P22AR C-terminal domain-containing protein [Aggregatibacter actinomycetemcomitans]